MTGQSIMSPHAAMNGKLYIKMTRTGEYFLKSCATIKTLPQIPAHAECGIVREEENGEKLAYPVTFVKDENGIWKIMEY